MKVNLHDTLLQRRLYERLNGMLGDLRSLPKVLIAQGRKTQFKGMGSVLYKTLGVEKLYEDAGQVALSLFQFQPSDALGQMRQENVAYFLVHIDQKKAQAAPDNRYFKNTDSLRIKLPEGVLTSPQSLLGSFIEEKQLYPTEKEGLQSVLKMMGINPRILDTFDRGFIAPREHRFGLFCNVSLDKMLSQAHEVGYRFEQPRIVKPMQKMQELSVSDRQQTHGGEVIKLSLKGGREVSLQVTGLKPSEKTQDVLREVLSPRMHAELEKTQRSVETPTPAKQTEQRQERRHRISHSL
jgi:hypothetical protein